jgi:hypothetical protein
MFAYEYLKENPKQRDVLVKEGWAQLFTNTDVPFSVKEELKELTANSLKLSDDVLYWHSVMLMDNIIDGKLININFLCSKWSLQLYTILQKYDFPSGMVYRCKHIISLFDNRTKMFELTLDDVEDCVDYTAINTRYNNIEQLICYTFLKRSDISLGNCTVLLQNCTFSLIKKLTNIQQITRVIELLNDVDPHSELFDSINEIERAHDARTERMTQELVARVGDKGYAYNDEFVTIAKENGFIVPGGPLALIKRGEQHHNCVGTYDSKHKAFGYSYQTLQRILFTTTATLEIVFHIRHTIIVSTSINQFKGMYNKDKDLDISISKLQVAFTGKPVSILCIKEC